MNSSVAVYPQGTNGASSNKHEVEQKAISEQRPSHAINLWFAETQSIDAEKTCDQKQNLMWSVAVAVVGICSCSFSCHCLRSCTTAIVPNNILTAKKSLLGAEKIEIAMVTAVRITIQKYERYE